MAKLKCHGKELFRFEKTEVKEDMTIRRQMALFEDRVVLEKVDVYRIEGHSTPGRWKKRLRVQIGKNAVLRDNLLKLGYEIIGGTLAPKPKEAS